MTPGNLAPGGVPDPDPAGALPVAGCTVRDYWDAIDASDFPKAQVIAEHQRIAAEQDGETDIARIWAALAEHAERRGLQADRPDRLH